MNRPRNRRRWAVRLRVALPLALAATAGALVAFVPPVQAAAADLVTTVHQAFVVVFVDAATFLQSCF